MRTNYQNGEIVQHLVSRRVAIVTDNAYGAIGGYILSDQASELVGPVTVARWVPTDEYVTWQYRDIYRLMPANNQVAIDMGIAAS